MLKLSEMQATLKIERESLETQIMSKIGTSEEATLWAKLIEVRTKIDALSEEKL